MLLLRQSTGREPSIHTPSAVSLPDGLRLAVASSEEERGRDEHRSSSDVNPHSSPLGFDSFLCNAQAMRNFSHALAVTSECRVVQIGHRAWGALKDIMQNSKVVSRDLNMIQVISCGKFEAK